MAITYLNDFDYTDHELANLILKDVKLGEAPASPEPYDIYRLPDGTPVYVNTAGIVRPIHEDSLTEISGVGPLSFVTNGRSVQAAIAEATADSPGIITADNYKLLAGASVTGTPGTLVMRDERGVSGFDTVITYELRASIISNLDFPQAPDNATRKDFVEQLVEQAIATANSVSAENVNTVAGTAPILVNRTGQDVTIDIAPADATNPGTLSPEHYALLDRATSARSYETLVKRDENGYVTVDRLTAEEDVNVAGNIAVGNIVQAVRFQTANVSISQDSIAGLSGNPIRDDYAASAGFVRNQIQMAVRDAIAGLDRKSQGIRLAFATNLPLTTTGGTYQGITLTPNDSILLFGQTNPAENGAYSFTTGGLIRRTDSNNPANLTTGALYQVEAGDYANHAFSLITQPGFVIDRDALTFLDLSGVNVIKGSDSVQIVDQVISITPQYDATVNDRVAAAVAPLQDATEVNALISTALTNYAAAGEFTAVVGDGTALEFTITHNLNNPFPSAMGFYNGSALGGLDYSPAGPNAITVRASLGNSPIGLKSLTVVVQAKRG